MTDADEVGTHRQLMFYLRAAVFPTVLRYNGRILRTTGDGFLAEFASAVDAAWCACEIQQFINTRERSAAEPNRFQLRLGINFGDVIIDNDMVYGEVVNIAARIESLALPGTVYVTETVRTHLTQIRYFEFHDLGFQTLKNVSSPVHVFQLVAADTDVLARPGQIDALPIGLSLVGTPSIAVLPLEIDGGDGIQAALARMLSEAIAARLTAWRWIKVFAPEALVSHTQFAGDPIRAARALDVRYILKGRLHAAPPRWRLTVHLVDGISGHQLWAKTLDKPTSDAAAVEDEIAMKVSAAIDLELQKSERDRSMSKSPDQLDAFDLVQRGYWHYAQRTLNHNTYAYRMFSEALQRNPKFSPAAAGQAACLFWAGQRRWTDEPEISLRKGLRAASGAVTADELYPVAHLILGQNFLFLGQQEVAIASTRHALDLNPSYAGAWAFLGHALTATGSFRAAIRMMRRAFQLTPHDGRRFMWLSNLALAHFHLREIDRALAVANEAAALNPGHWLSNQVLVMALAELDRTDEAKAWIKTIRDEEPNVGLYEFANRLPYRRESDLSRVVTALQRAGWDR